MKKDIEKLVDFLHDLFRRGFLVDSPHFIVRKQPDGRYEIRLRR